MPSRGVSDTNGGVEGASKCQTHDLWEELGNQIHLYLSSVSLADVCERRVLGTSGRLYCERLAAATGTG